MSFRVGDKVKCVKPSLYDKWYVPLNVEFIVINISKYGTIKLNFNDNLWYNADRFVLLGPRESNICLKIREMESRRKNNAF